MNLKKKIAQQDALLKQYVESSVKTKETAKSEIEKYVKEADAKVVANTKQVQAVVDAILKKYAEEDTKTKVTIAKEDAHAKAKAEIEQQLIKTNAKIESMTKEMIEEFKKEMAQQYPLLTQYGNEKAIKDTLAKQNTEQAEPKTPTADQPPGKQLEANKLKQKQRL